MKKVILIIILIQISILSIVGQPISTNAEIYNFDIGDIFHYYEELSDKALQLILKVILL